MLFDMGHVVSSGLWAARSTLLSNLARVHGLDLTQESCVKSPTSVFWPLCCLWSAASEARIGTLLGMLPTVAPRESRLPHKLYVMDEGVFGGSCT